MWGEENGKGKEEMGNLDITEAEPLDNLQNPEGIIKEAIEISEELDKITVANAGRMSNVKSQKSGDC